MERESFTDDQNFRPPNLRAAVLRATAKNAGRSAWVCSIFFVYWVLTLLATSDRQLVFDRTVFLPGLNVGVPLNVFFVLVPVVALLPFLQLQFYLHRWSDLIEELRSDEAKAGKTYVIPWITAAALSSPPGVLGAGLRFLVRFALWTMLPLALILNILKFIPVHEPVWTFVVAGIAVAETVVVYFFWRRASRRHTSICKVVLRHLGFASLFIGEAVILIGLIPWSQAGYLPPLLATNFVGNFVSSYVFADLNHVELISRVNEKSERSRLRPDFQGIHLEGAFLFHADLSQSSFESAFFRRAKMNRANLEGTNFEFANLIEAQMNYADLRKADFRQAILIGARLMGANLQDADLRNSSLQYLFLQYVDARGADFSLANLSYSNLFDSNLQGAKLRGATLQDGRAQRTDFGQADLSHADFKGADVWESTFQGANLQGANFVGATNLSVDQLSQAKTLYNATLPPELYSQIKEKFPHLLEKPRGKEGS